jgi:hypothetical protein
MVPANSLRLLSIFSLALLNISFGTVPANALAVERSHMARGINHVHANVAKKRRDKPAQCKPRPTAPSYSSSLATPSPVSQPPPNSIAASSPQSAEPSSTPSATPSSSGSSGSAKIILMWSNEEQSSICKFLTKAILMCVYMSVHPCPSSLNTLDQVR